MAKRRNRSTRHHEAGSGEIPGLSVLGDEIPFARVKSEHDPREVKVVDGTGWQRVPDDFFKKGQSVFEEGAYEGAFKTIALGFRYEDRRPFAYETDGLVEHPGVKDGLPLGRIIYRFESGRWNDLPEWREGVDNTGDLKRVLYGTPDPE